MQYNNRSKINVHLMCEFDTLKRVLSDINIIYENNSFIFNNFESNYKKISSNDIERFRRLLMICSIDHQEALADDFLRNIIYFYIGTGKKIEINMFFIIIFFNYFYLPNLNDRSLLRNLSVFLKYAITDKKMSFHSVLSVNNETLRFMSKLKITFEELDAVLKEKKKFREGKNYITYNVLCPLIHSSSLFDVSLVREDFFFAKLDKISKLK